ncbi:hypothetical protein Enr8_34240 [Blastopirellula retiformator]|uniref:Uncharacterized protein n=1 Tax=Blastopirellula retiformator TaxID=2527970 RepID=A0A5C5V183_9BACT|nr:hypothetical protein Enr8_34240 [Blastopirellula retiformator]
MIAEMFFLLTFGNVRWTLLFWLSEPARSG